MTKDPTLNAQIAYDIAHKAYEKAKAGVDTQAVRKTGKALQAASAALLRAEIDQMKEGAA